MSVCPYLIFTVMFTFPHPLRRYVWGSNSHGQLGIGVNRVGDEVKLPMLLDVKGFGGGKGKEFNKVKLTQVALGRRYSLAVDEYGRVWSWGDGSDGVLAMGDTQARPVPHVVDA